MTQESVLARPTGAVVDDERRSSAGPAAAVATAGVAATATAGAATNTPTPAATTKPQHADRLPPLALRFKSKSLSQQQEQQQQQQSASNSRKHAKRLTLHFPIVISDGVTAPAPSAPVHAHAHAPTAAHPPPPAAPGDAAMFFQTPKQPPSDPSLTSPEAFENNHADDGAAFLTALAAQERKVLELREELQKAEAELTSLKRQWAASERSKKTTEMRFHTEALRSMRRPSGTPATVAAVATAAADAGVGKLEESADLDALREQVRPGRELGRRASSARHSPSLSMASSAGCPSPARSSKPRTVFQGSKHTRTLSLLANSSHPGTPFSQPHDIRNHRARQASRAVTLPSIDVTKQSVLSPQSQRQPPESATLRRAFAHNPTAEAFVRTGQQMAADFKDNLWTFLEDIRQATVGEDLSRYNTRAAQHTGSDARPSAARYPRHSETRSVSGPVGRSSTSSERRTASQDGNDEAAFWKEFGVEIESSASSRSASRSVPRAAKPAEHHKLAREKQQRQQSQHPQQQSSGDDLLDFDDDNWDMWDNSPEMTRPGKPVSHTPCSSTSTWPSKQSHSPASTAASSPTMSASFTDLHRHAAADGEQGSRSGSGSGSPGSQESGASELTAKKKTNSSDSIPWPAFRDLAPSKLTKTASTLMAEWERSLSASPSPERVMSPKADKFD